ncbi:hypothetical protein PI125_g4650 [Phytophthora idaei]|nr:hypothetical protein PI125_g4650 [Phytophthora idaei]
MSTCEQVLREQAMCSGRTTASLVCDGTSRHRHVFKDYARHSSMLLLSWVWYSTDLAMKAWVCLRGSYRERGRLPMAAAEEQANGPTERTS